MSSSACDRSRCTVLRIGEGRRDRVTSHEEGYGDVPWVRTVAQGWALNAASKLIAAYLPIGGLDAESRAFLRRATASESAQTRALWRRISPWSIWSLVARVQDPLCRPETHACVALDQTNIPAPVSPPVRSRQRSGAPSPKIMAWSPASAKAIATAPARKKTGARRMLM